MADLTNRERLQPSLLDRLTDNEPQKRSESRDDRVLSVDRLKQCVLRDLEWLLNTENLCSPVDFGRYPEIQSSVLNFGRPALSGKAGSTVDLKQLQSQIHQAILSFEPRIIADTLQILIQYDDDVQSNNSLRFEIRGQLFAQPLPLSLFLRTDVDLESGVIHVIEE
ncbi:lysozyme-like protein [Novipirellula galeiformis]|uniref:Lysozyme-like protein n=1 Tax=Novipirellula galeiformis TaxID=2528004 RepID=A0A5C6CGW6_9BACT|nr:type VI secretion system baseplate subunit TssE [Novipirellula galeiformis]TWU23432.1 lysozyme-like protein [Novipirellula galeiformis]